MKRRDVFRETIVCAESIVSVRQRDNVNRQHNQRRAEVRSPIGDYIEPHPNPRQQLRRELQHNDQGHS